MSESSNETKSYVHEGIEVILTGRQAKKEKKRGTTRRASATVPTFDLIYEIVPKDNEVGSWKKWVKMSELFEIINN